MKDDEKEIVVERLKTLPSNMRMMIGDEGKFDKNQMINEVVGESEIGELIVQIYMRKSASV